MTFESDLRDRLQADAATFVPVGAGVSRAQARARQRRQRVVGAGMAAVLLTGAVAVPRLLDRDSGQTVSVASEGGDAGSGGTASDPAAGTAVDPAATGTQVEFAWQEQDAYVSNVWRDQVVTTADGVTYALSTAPGTTWEEFGFGEEPIPQGIYRSVDGGQTWDVALPPDDVRLGSSLTERNGVLYTVSTSSSADDATEVGIVSSADGGANWDRTTLPIDVMAPTDVVTVRPITQVDVEWAGDTAVAVASVNWWIDESTLWPVYGESAGAMVGEDGIQIIDWAAEGAVPPTTITVVPDEPVVDEAADAAAEEAAAIEADNGEFAEEAYEPEVIETIPWDELGVDGPEDFVSTQVFRSTDGATWDEVEEAGEVVSGVSTSIVSTPEGFLLSSWPAVNDGEDGPRYFTSTDGTTWDELAPPFWLGELSVLGDQIVATAYSWTDDGQRYEVYVSPDLGRTWTLSWSREASHSTELQGVAGPLGLAITETEFDELTGMPSGPTMLHFSPDGTSWSSSEVPIPVEQGAWPQFVTANSVVLGSIDLEAEDGSTRTWIGTPTRQG